MTQFFLNTDVFCIYSGEDTSSLSSSWIWRLVRVYGEMYGATYQEEKPIRGCKAQGVLASIRMALNIQPELNV